MLLTLGGAAYLDYSVYRVYKNYKQYAVYLDLSLFPLPSGRMPDKTFLAFSIITFCCKLRCKLARRMGAKDGERERTADTKNQQDTAKQLIS